MPRSGRGGDGPPGPGLRIHRGAQVRKGQRGRGIRSASDGGTQGGGGFHRSLPRRVTVEVFYAGVGCADRCHPGWVCGDRLMMITLTVVFGFKENENMFSGSPKSRGPRARCPGYAGPGRSSLGGAEGRRRRGGRWSRAGWILTGLSGATAHTDGAGQTEGQPGRRAELSAERAPGKGRLASSVLDKPSLRTP